VDRQAGVMMGHLDRVGELDVKVLSGPVFEHFDRAGGHAQVGVIEQWCDLPDTRLGRSVLEVI
jgi:hypothetical protein